MHFEEQSKIRPFLAKDCLRSASTALVPLVAVGLILGGCAGPKEKKVSKPAKSKTVVTTKAPTTNTEHINEETKFSSKEYGVAGSPRVTAAKRTRKGGGRYQVGKPYKVRGIWYKPKEDPNLKEVGLASWYGPNFHGRLTANGEVYDQYGISAAHPTMPLPSYAMVTNLENGRKIKVRVNDRGPFSRGRVIDLSARAAELLGYTHQGVAKVKVEYAGKARMDGLDEELLLASYQGPGVPSQIPNGSSSGTMIAMADTPSSPTAASAIENSFQTQQATFSGAVPVPTIRPTLFEGVPLARTESDIVYRPVAGAATSVLERVPRPLAFASEIDEEIVPIFKFVGEKDVYQSEHPKNAITIDIGILNGADAHNMLVSLIGSAGEIEIETEKNLTSITTTERQANQLLDYLYEIGLSAAVIR